MAQPTPPAAPRQVPAQDPRDDYLRLEPYLPEMHDACMIEGEDVALVAGVVLRECLAGWGAGYDPKGTHVGTGDRGARVWSAARLERDRELVKVVGEVRVEEPGKPGVLATRYKVVPRDERGWGRFLVQIDWVGPYGHLARECPAPEPFLQFRWGCWVLRDARKELLGHLGQAFARDPLFEVAAICSYNAGSAAVARAIKAGRHPDLATTDGADEDKDGDYGSDVMRRRDRLRTRYPDRFPPFRDGLRIA